MTKYFTFYFLFVSYVVSAQISSCDYLEKAVEHFQNKELDSAIALMTKAVEETPDTTNCYGRCMNNIPLAYAMRGDFDNAILWFDKILDSNLDDLQPGTSIMEPYANYHHNACMKLVQVYESLEKPQMALKYLNLAETSYPYQTFSGTSFEKRAVSITQMKARLYEGLGKKDSVLFIQLSKILDTDIRYRKPDYESLSNVNFYAELIVNVKELIGEDQLDTERKKLKKAIQDIEMSQSGDMRVGTFNFRGLEYKIGVSDNSKTRKQVIQKLMQNEFFK